MIIFAQKFAFGIRPLIVALTLGYFVVMAHGTSACTFSANELVVLNTFHFRDAGGQSPDFCAPKSFARKVLDGLLFIKARHWQGSAGDEFDRGLLPAEPFDFLVPRVRVFILDSASSKYCGPSVGARNLDHSGVINICPAIMGINVFEVATMLIHESRHTDGDGFLHVNCESGKLNVEGGSCDANYEGGGAYAAGTEFAVRVSRDSSVGEDVRTYARNFAIQEFYARFVTKPFGIRPMVALESADGAVTMYDGNAAYGFGLQIKPTALTLALRAHELKVFDSTRGTSTEILHAGSYFAPKDELSKFYAERIGESERARVLDFAYSANYSCMLFAESLKCLGSDGSIIQNLAFNRFRAKAFLDISQSSTDREGILYIVGDDGATHVLPADVQGMIDLRPGDLESNGVPSRLLNLAILGDAQIALMTDGTIARYSTISRTWSKIPQFERRHFVKLLGTVDWSERIQRLRDEPNFAVAVGRI